MILTLTRSYEAIIDDADYELVKHRKWHAHSAIWGIYARCTINYTKVYLHRLLMNAPADMEVDHINGNTLDCRRENMQLLTKRENVMLANERRREKKAELSEKIQSIVDARDDIPF